MQTKDISTKKTHTPRPHLGVSHLWQRDPGAAHMAVMDIDRRPRSPSQASSGWWQVVKHRSNASHPVVPVGPNSHQGRERTSVGTRSQSIHPKHGSSLQKHMEMRFGPKKGTPQKSHQGVQRKCFLWEALEFRKGSLSIGLIWIIGCTSEMRWYLKNYFFTVYIVISYKLYIL